MVVDEAESSSPASHEMIFSIRLPDTSSEYVMKSTPLPRLPPAPRPLLFFRAAALMLLLPPLLLLLLI